MKKRSMCALVVAVAFSVMWVALASAARMAPGPSKDPNTGKAYAGSEACKVCHAKQYKDWKNTIHAWMVRPIA